MVKKDGKALAIPITPLLHAEIFWELVGLLARLDLERQRAAHSASNRRETLGRGQLAHVQNYLLEGAVDVDGGEDGDQVLDLDLGLGDVSRDVDLLEDVS